MLISQIFTSLITDSIVNSFFFRISFFNWYLWIQGKNIFLLCSFSERLCLCEMWRVEIRWMDTVWARALNFFFSKSYDRMYEIRGKIYLVFCPQFLQEKGQVKVLNLNFDFRTIVYHDQRRTTLIQVGIFNFYPALTDLLFLKTILIILDLTMPPSPFSKVFHISLFQGSPNWAVLKSFIHIYI